MGEDFEAEDDGSYSSQVEDDRYFPAEDDGYFHSEDNESFQAEDDGSSQTEGDGPSQADHDRYRQTMSILTRAQRALLQALVTNLNIVETGDRPSREAASGRILRYMGSLLQSYRARAARPPRLDPSREELIRAVTLAINEDIVDPGVREDARRQLLVLLQARTPMFRDWMEQLVPRDDDEYPFFIHPRCLFFFPAPSPASWLRLLLRNEEGGVEFEIDAVVDAEAWALVRSEPWFMPDVTADG